MLLFLLGDSDPLSYLQLKAKCSQWKYLYVIQNKLPSNPPDVDVQSQFAANDKNKEEQEGDLYSLRGSW